MAKRKIGAEKKPPRISYLARSPSEPNEVMSLDESETLLGSMTITPQPYHQRRDSSMNSISTQSTILTANSKMMSPAVTVVDIDTKFGGPNNNNNNNGFVDSGDLDGKLGRRQSYEGFIDEVSQQSKNKLHLIANTNQPPSISDLSSNSPNIGGQSGESFYLSC